MSNPLKREPNNENNFTEEWNSLINKVQTFNSLVLKKVFPLYSDFSNIVSGKFGAPASFANLMTKYKTGEDTVNDWLGASADIALLRLC
ncbi:hypothetical protein [Citrobacter meridianamericanus]|uniref:hypothetical protein n=1 Tax=Citrobacter meridianamericanus TaxID=2894201 RepID=UPI00351D2728